MRIADLPTGHLEGIIRRSRLTEPYECPAKDWGTFYGNRSVWRGRRSHILANLAFEEIQRREWAAAFELPEVGETILHTDYNGDHCVHGGMVDYDLCMEGQAAEAKWQAWSERYC